MAASPREEGLALLFSPALDEGGWGTRRLVDRVAEQGDCEGARRARARIGRLAVFSTRKLMRTAEARTAAGLGPEQLQHQEGGKLATWALILERRWGQNFRQPSAVLERLKHLPPVSLINDELGHWLMSVTSSGLAPEAWKRQQTFGVLADIYLRDLIEFATRLADDSPQERDELVERLLDLVDPSSTPPFSEAPMKGNSWLVLNVHSGAYRFGKWVRNKILLNENIFVIGAGGERETRQYASVRDDPMRALMLLIRHLRKNGIGGMGLDGQYGESGRTLAVAGREVRLAHGPAHAVFHARCRNTFVLSQWRDGKVVFQMNEGPLPENGEAIDRWTDRWFAWLRGPLEELVTGPPCNIRGYSGIWSKLAPNSMEDDD